MGDPLTKSNRRQECGRSVERGPWGYIENPVSKNKSVGFTEEGKAKAEELFWKLFGKST